MKTYFNIIQTILKRKTIFYPDEHIPNYLSFAINSINPPDNIIMNLFFYNLIIDMHQKKRKFASLEERLKNVFISDYDKNEIFNILCKIQRTYYALNRIAFLYKYKKSKIQVNVDLNMVPVDTSKTHIEIYQNEFRYLFKLTDIINIINTALTHTFTYSYFYPEPLPIKNPYNNMCFSKPVLYNIYFRLKNSTFIMPILFHKFFLADFELKHFAEFNFELISECAIKNYLLNTSDDDLKDDVFTMLDDYCLNELNIHRDFPAEKLVNIFKPFLFLYFIVISTTKDILRKKVSRELLENKLDKFYLFNPKFGRISYSIVRQPVDVRQSLDISNNLLVNSTNIELDGMTENNLAKKTKCMIKTFNDNYLPYNKL